MHSVLIFVSKLNHDLAYFFINFIENEKSQFKRDIFYHLSVISYRLNQNDDCLQYAQESIFQDPDWAYGYLQMGICQAAKGQLLASVESFENARIRGKIPQAYVRLSIAYYQLKEYQKSLDIFYLAVAQAQEEVYRNFDAVLAVFYSAMELRKFDEAIVMLQDWRKYNPEIGALLSYKIAQKDLAVQLLRQKNQFNLL